MKSIEIEIPADLRERLESLPDSAQKPGITWTPEMDAALLAYWPVKRHTDIAKILGVSENSARYRYRFLTEGQHGN